MGAAKHTQCKRCLLRSLVLPQPPLMQLMYYFAESAIRTRTIRLSPWHNMVRRHFPSARRQITQREEWLWKKIYATKCESIWRFSPRGRKKKQFGTKLQRIHTCIFSTWAFVVDAVKALSVLIAHHAMCAMFKNKRAGYWFTRRRVLSMV